jgi:acyl-CoA synthetase (AMP-forming)/AMP-acid ligase II
VARAGAETAAALHGAPAALSGELGVGVSRWTRRGGATLGGALAVVAVLAAASPPRATAAWGGLAAPLRVLAQPTLEPLTIHPGTVEGPRGSDVEVRVEAPGRSVDAVTLALAAGGVPRRPLLRWLLRWRQLKAPFTAAELIAHCKGLLAGYKVPKEIRFEPIPKTSTGKIQKFQLRERAKSASAIE